MSSPPPLPLARRTAGGIVVDERPARVSCRWTDLPSNDGERFDVEWAGHVACVDTPADRALLCERLMADEDATLAVERIARLLVEELRPGIARWLAQRPAALALDGSGDAELAALIEADARRAGFAAGLRVAPPFAMRLDSPTVRRAQAAARARRHLDAIAGDRAARDEVADEMRSAIAADDGPRATRAAQRLEPRDLLAAVAIADARWSAATPSLWAVAGEALLRIDPTRPELSATPIVVGGVGPLRSVRGATLEGRARLLVGGRDGVAIVDAGGGAPRVFARAASGDNGFNAACLLGGELLATHAGHGLVRWRLDAPARPSELVNIGADARGARLLTAVGDDVALLVDDRGALLRVGPDDDAATPIGASASAVVALATLDDGRAVVADAARHVAIVHPRDPAGGPITPTRVSAGVESLAAIDLCGLPRILIAGDDGTVALVDPETGESTPIGGKWSARAIRARPGFVALLGVDRTRVGIVDLSRPESPITELHVHALLGRRAADICFA